MAVDIALILLETGRLSPEKLEEAREEASAKGTGFEEAITSLGILDEDAIAQALGAYFDIPGLSLAKLPKPDPRVTRFIPEPVARAKEVIPLEKAGDTLICLMADPTDVSAIEGIRKGAGLEVQPVAGSPATVRVALDTFYAPAPTSLLAKAQPVVAKLVTEEAARSYRALPVTRDGDLVTVAMAEVSDKTTKAIEMATGLKVTPVQADAADLERAIDRIFKGGSATQAAKPAAREPKPAGQPAPGSLDGLLDGALESGEAPPSVVPSGGGPGGALSLDFGSDDAKPAAAAEPSKPSGGGGLSLDFGASAGTTSTSGSGGTAGPPPPPPPEQRKQPPTSESDISFDSLLANGDDQTPRPAEKPARGNGRGQEQELAAIASEPDEEGDVGPNLGPAGQEGGPRTGLSVEPDDLDAARAIVAKRWGELDRNLGKVVPERVARNYRIVVTGRREKKIYAALEDPKDTFAIETLEFVTGLAAEVEQASPEEIAAGLEVLYSREVDDLAQIMDELATVGLDDVEQREELEELSAMDAAEAAEAAPIVRLVNLVIDKGLSARASDIHFETYEEHLRVRYRVDGVLREVMRPPVDLRDPIISRLKILGRMDISERRMPQDGRLRMRKTNEAGGVKDIDFRVSSVPTIHGEKVVMRILDKDKVRLDLRELGMEQEPLEHFREAIHRPYGMVLVVGPSGCGKTNTLYSALADVNTTDVNIMTCEDPVEFSTTGLNQVQARDSIGLNFATALRSFLRQDPNVILVGEVRDFETAEIAVKAALTGHMVLSTLHTNDAPACLNRLTNMGVEPFLIATSLHLVCSQRLVRVLCEGCREPDDSIGTDQLVQMGFTPEQARQVEPMRGAGCKKCERTGFYGRTGIYEVMRITDEMREMILFNGSQLEIKELARREGMRTLRESGLTKILEGVTTPEEVVRETIG